jgi:hypothetical protein
LYCIEKECINFVIPPNPGLLATIHKSHCIDENTNAIVNNDGDIQNLLKDKMELILQVGGTNEDQKINGAAQSEYIKLNQF